MNEDKNSVEQSQNKSPVANNRVNVVKPLHTAEEINADKQNEKPTSSFHPPADINKIYQQPLETGPAANTPVAANQATPNPQLVSNKAQIINVIIIILGIYIGGSALIGIIGRVTNLSLGIPGIGWVIFILDMLYLVLAVGIILKNNLARVTYILLAIIGLIISIAITVHYYKDYKAVTQNVYSSAANSTEKLIQNYKSDTLIPASQRAQIVQNEQNELNQEESVVNADNKALSSANRKVVIAFAEGYALALIPLIVLTRKSVREQFN